MIGQSCRHRWSTWSPHLRRATTVGGFRYQEWLAQTCVRQHEVVIDLKQGQLIPQARVALTQGIDPAPDRRDALADVEVKPVTVDGGIAPSTSASKPCVPLSRHTAPQ